MESGVVKTDPLITHAFAISQWQEAFDIFEARSGVKTLLTPVAVA